MKVDSIIHVTANNSQVCKSKPNWDVRKLGKIVRTVEIIHNVVMIRKLQIKKFSNYISIQVLTNGKDLIHQKLS